MGFEQQYPLLALSSKKLRERIRGPTRGRMETGSGLKTSLQVENTRGNFIVRRTGLLAHNTDTLCGISPKFPVIEYKIKLLTLYDLVVRSTENKMVFHADLYRLGMGIKRKTFTLITFRSLRAHLLSLQVLPA